MDNHRAITGADNPLSWGDVWRKVKALNSSDQLRLCSWIDPFSVVNINLRTGKDDARILRNLDNRIYKGAVLGPLFQSLLSSIEEKGALTPIWAWEIPPDHEYWKKRRKTYYKGAYVIEDGRHRALACQLLDRPTPAFIIEAI